MMSKKLIGSALAVLVCAAAVWFVFFRGDEKSVILKRFAEAVAAAEKVSEEGNIAMVAKHQTLGFLLTDTLTVSLTRPPMNGDYDTQELLSRYAAARQHCKTIRITCSGEEVSLLSGTEAQLTCLAAFKADSAMGRWEEKCPVIVSFVKRDGKWLIQAIEEKKVFKR